MTTAGLLPAPITLDVNRELLHYIDTNFKRLDQYLGSGTITASGSGGVQISPGIELYHPSSTPYIDFHRAADSTGDAGADYDIRLINSDDGRLIIEMLPDDSSLDIWLNAGLMQLTFLGTTRHQWWNNGEYNCTAIGVGGDNINNNGIVVHNGFVEAQNARMYQYDSTYAGFKHKDNADYSILSRNSGLLLLRAGGSDQRVLIGTATGSWDLEVHAAEIYHRTPLQQYGSIYMNDNWVRSIGAVGIYNQSYAGGWYMIRASEIRSYADKRVSYSSNYSGGLHPGGGDTGWGFNSFHNGGTYYTTEVKYNSTGGSQDRRGGVYDHRIGWMFYGQDSGGCDARSNWFIFSSEKVKKNIRSMDRMDTLKKIRDVRACEFQNEWENRMSLGVLGEDMFQLFPKACRITSDEERRNGLPDVLVSYGALIAPVISALQALDTKVEHIESRLNISEEDVLGILRPTPMVTVECDNCGAKAETEDVGEVKPENWLKVWGPSDKLGEYFFCSGACYDTWLEDI